MKYPIERAADALITYATETFNAILFGGDWAAAQRAYDDLQAAAIDLAGQLIAASSGADTELDYYGGDQ